MNKSNKLLSDLVAFRTYAKYLQHLSRRESLAETINRNMSMHLERFPKLSRDIIKAFKQVHDMKAMPSMRAIDDDFPILTKEGFKKIGEVKVGDILYSSSGEETTVLELAKFTDIELYNVKFSGNTTIPTCLEHLWIVTTLEDLKNGRKSRVVSTENIKDNLKQGCKFNFRVFNPNPLKFSKKELPIHPYILGYWLGNGYSNGTQISISLEDSTFITSQHEKHGFKCKKSNSSNIWTYNISGLKKKLKEINLVKNKHVPDIYLYADEEQRLSFLQGLVDSDGCVDTTGRVTFTNGNQSIIKGLKFLLSTLGIHYTCSKVAKKAAHHLELEVVSFFTSKKVSLLPRKATRLKKHENLRTQCRRIVGVSYLKKGSATCFKVDSKDRSFLVGNDLIVTHNSMQFGGEAILKNNTRIFNCSYLHFNYTRAFAETLYLLLCGVGVGYSVQKNIISQLPQIKKPRRENPYSIHDSIEGWADAVDTLFNAYFYGAVRPIFDYSQISPKGTYLLTTGSKAPGAEPLRLALNSVETRLQKSIGKKLGSLEIHDVVCILADCVLSGGIRRAALIALFDKNDNDMLTCKQGEWWVKHPYRARANNSALLPRKETTKKDFLDIFEACIDSKCGEPGFVWTNDLTQGTNPSLRAGTKIITKKGIINIEDLENQEFEVPNLEGNISKARCWKSGTNIDLWELTLDTGKKYYASPEHKWPIYCNNRFIKCESNKLKKGDKLPLNVFERDELFTGGYKGTYNQGFLIGWLYGDGSITVRTDTKRKVASFIVSKKDGANILSLLLEEINKIDRVKRKVYERGECFKFQVDSPEFIAWLDFMSVFKKNEGLPSELLSSWTEEARRGFIDGLFSSDGHVPTKSHGIKLISSRKKLAEDFQDLLGMYGVKSTLTFKEVIGGNFSNGVCYNRTYTKYCLRVTCGSMNRFKKLFKLSVEHKQRNLDQCVYPIKEEFIIIKDIKLTSLKEDVWDISVFDNTHCFQLTQVTTGNCAEISLNSNQFCNLTSSNMTDIKSEKDFHNRVYAAALLGTLQASYTDFPYLSDKWKEITEKEALLGCSFTGIADASNMNASQLQTAAKLVLEVNEKYSKILGINKAARACAIKPEGSASALLGASSGIHARHSQFYLRRIRINKEESLAKYLKLTIPHLVEDDLFSSRDIVVTIPQMSPEGAVLRENESALQLLERVNFYNKNWITPGHRSGANKHNVSVTINYKPEEIEELAEEMWRTRDFYSGISLLPADGGTYQQAPFEACTEEVFKQYDELVKNIDLTKVLEMDDQTNMLDQAACQGGLCEIK